MGLPENPPVGGAGAGDESKLLLPVLVQFGDVTLEPLLARLTPGRVGIAEVQIRVPIDAAGDYPDVGPRRRYCERLGAGVSRKQVKPRLLRGWAVQANFSQPLPLADAIAKLGFVQADPIRSPARAQDLILRQRVPGYRAGDLEALYPKLDIEEDFLYAYGFLPRATWRLLHPKRRPKLTALERRVHELVLELGDVHPSSLEAHLGARRAVNAWGGYSTGVDARARPATLLRAPARGAPGKGNSRVHAGTPKPRCGGVRGRASCAGW